MTSSGSARAGAHSLASSSPTPIGGGGGEKPVTPGSPTGDHSDHGDQGGPTGSPTSPAELQGLLKHGNEPWHYEPRPDAAEGGCPRMYADPTHDPRMHE